jgi:cytoskeletal protein RodZ
MADWLPLQQVAELQPLLAATGNGGGYGAPAQAAAYPSPGGYDAPAAATPTPMAAAAPAAAKRGSRASVDLFGGGLAEEVARPAAPMPPPSLGDKHVGERNETSVLFSLKDLTAAENAAKNSAKASPFDSSDRVDDILSLGGGGAAPMLAPPPMNAPVIEPPPPPPPSVAPVAAAAMPMQYAMAPQKKSPMPIVFAGIGVAALLGGILFFVMSGGKDDASKDAKPTAAADAKTAEPSKPKETSTPTDTKAPTTSEPVATAPTTATADTTATTTATPTTEDPKNASTAKVATNDPTAKTTATTDTKKTADAPKEEPKEEPKAAGGDTPFDRGAASAALNGAAGSAKGCKKPDGPTGSAKVQVTFAPSGKATQATVGAPFAGTGVGSCIASAFKGLKVPPFTGAPVTVSKTVNIK